MRFRIVIFLFFFSIVDVNGGLSQSFGADLSYLSTIETKVGNLSVEVHFDKNNLWLAKKVLKILQEKSPAVLNYFNYSPSDPIHFVINEDSYTANGAALVFPRNLIYLNDFPPLNEGHLIINSNWVESLVIHELVHILHMDQTRGFLSLVRSLFGSIGKMGGVVPRWFIEGAAVWAESEFLEGGRLKNKNLQREFLSRLEDPNFCQTIDCLDEPGEYPFASYPYWVGSFFLEYLEKLKVGTIRCLIYENSKTIPFNLNRAFRRCSGRSLWKNFNNFRSKSLKNLEAKRQTFHRSISKFKLKKHLEKTIGPIHWQKGTGLIGDDFIFVQNDEGIPQLAHYSLSSQSLKSSKPKYPIDNILFSRQDLVFSTSLKGEKKVWSILNNRKESYDYILKISPKKFLGLKYESEHWKIFKGIKKEKRSLIKEFPRGVQIEAPSLLNIKGKIFLGLKIYDELKSEKYSAVRIRISDLIRKRGAFSTIYASKKAFNLLSSCHKTTLIKNHLGEYFTLSDQFKNKIDPFNGSDLIKILWNDNHSIFLFSEGTDSFYSSKNGCQEWIKKWEKKKKSHIKFAKTIETKRKEEKFLSIKYEEESYPRLKHFLPNYWLFSYEGGNNQTDVWKIYTQLTDPKNRHNFGVSYDIYAGISQSAPQVNYNYKNGNFNLFLDFSKYYTTSSFGTEPDSIKALGASANYSVLFDNWYFSPGASISSLESKDFLSGGTVREEKTYGLSQTLGFSPIYKDDFFNKFSLFTSYEYHDLATRKGYRSFQGKMKFKFKFHRRFGVLGQGTYGKLYKRGFFDGVLYGGRQSSIGGRGTFHEFYGIPYTEIFGNNIQTNRLEFDWNTFKVHRSGGLFPLYLKNLNTLFGLERVKADRIFLENRFFRNEEFYASYFGVRIDTTFAYALPVQVDLLYSQIMSNKVNSNGQWLFLIKGSFTP